MKLFTASLCLLLCMTLAGCSQINIPFINKAAPIEPAESSEPAQIEYSSDEFVDEGRIVSKEKLIQGKNIAVIPFTAGVGAESTDELGRVALMIVKGVSDAFADDKTGKHAHFNILTAESSTDADLIVRGHITSMSGPSKLKKWTMLSKAKILAVEGKITDAQSGETVGFFTDQQELNSKDDGYKQLGYDIGKNIGKFILSGI